MIGGRLDALTVNALTVNERSKEFDSFIVSPKFCNPVSDYKTYAECIVKFLNEPLNAMTVNDLVQSIPHCPQQE
jgi:hypothetical protein